MDRKFNQNSKIRRFHSSVNRKSLPIISISCNSKYNSNLLTEGIDVFRKHYHCEHYKKPAICCFKHSSRISLYHNCRNYQNNCCNLSFCVNCNKEGHPSTSKDSKKKKKKKKIVSITIFSQYFPAYSLTDSIET